MSGLINQFHDRIDAVSYTHLDVYKRQSFNRVELGETAETRGSAYASGRHQNSLETVQLYQQLWFRGRHMEKCDGLFLWEKAKSNIIELK